MFGSDKRTSLLSHDTNLKTCVLRCELNSVESFVFLIVRTDIVNETSLSVENDKKLVSSLNLLETSHCVSDKLLSQSNIWEQARTPLGYAPVIPVHRRH